MAMVSMNIQDDDDMGRTCDYDPSPTIYLSDAQCKALGIGTAPPAGMAMTLTAKAIAQSVTQSTDGGKDDPDICMTLKLTYIEIGAAQSSTASLYD